MYDERIIGYLKIDKGLYFEEGILDGIRDP